MRTTARTHSAATVTDRPDAHGFEERQDDETATTWSNDAHDLLADGEDWERKIDHFLIHLDEIHREQRHAERYGFDYADPYHVERHIFHAPLVFELGDVRSLLANWSFVQSAMSIAEPDKLVLNYTRLMMGFLLFRPSPRTIEIIGLGGGSLVKYCYRHLPYARIRAIEIDPEVIAVADRFLLPPEGDRFEIICADGADFVRSDPKHCDILLVDGFDKQGQPAMLCSSEFYADCFSRLRTGGMLVANLCEYDQRNAAIQSRIRTCFGRTIVVPVDEGMNQIVFAFKGEAPPMDQATIRRSARSLDRAHPMSFSYIADKILARIRSDNRALATAMK